MPTNNESTIRKALLTAFGGTGSTNNERNWVKSLITAITNSNVKSKPAVVALVPLTGSVGTANDAMIAVPASTLATDFATQKTSIDAAITAINNNLADLQAKQNAVIAALKA